MLQGTRNEAETFSCYCKSEAREADVKNLNIKGSKHFRKELSVSPKAVVRTDGLALLF